MTLGISGVEIVSLRSNADDRGEFKKTYEPEMIADPFSIKQQNFVTTKYAYTFRGLHYQTGSQAEAKFFQVIKGEIQLVFVDMRENSSTYISSDTIHLEGDKAVYIPRGLATGYMTLTDDTQVLYFSDNSYSPKHESGIRWNDLAIDLQLLKTPKYISEKDLNWPSINE